MQDIEVRRGPRGLITLRVLYDNGSEVTLIRNAFAKKARFKWQPATYTLVGVGGQAQTYSNTNVGRLWSVVTLVRNAFVMKARFKWQPATYTLTGVGGTAQTYTDTSGGRIWSMMLQDNKGKTEVI